MTNGDQIDLLIGFDAVASFLEARWISAGKQSEALADLLSDMSRNHWRYAGPLDPALWGDWLDAVLSIRPDDAPVAEARRAIQDQYREFRATDDLPMPERKATLDRLRAKAADHTWHRVGDHLISTSEGYRAMGPFLTRFWRRDSPDFLAILDEIERNAGAEPRPDWLAAVAFARAHRDDSRPGLFARPHSEPRSD